MCWKIVMRMIPTLPEFGCPGEFVGLPGDEGRSEAGTGDRVRVRRREILSDNRNAGDAAAKSGPDHQPVEVEFPGHHLGGVVRCLAGTRSGRRPAAPKASPR